MLINIILIQHYEGFTMIKRFKNLKIGLKLTLAITLLLVISNVAISAIAIVITSNTLNTEITDKLDRSASDATKIITAKIDYYFSAVKNAAEDNNVKSMDWESSKPILKVKAENLGIIKMGISDLNGNAVYTNDSSTNIAQREYFNKAIKGETNISDPLMSTAENTTVVVIASPIINNDEVVGVMLATMEDKFITTIVSEANSGKTGYAFMLSKNGTTIAHPDVNMVINANNDIENAKKDSSLKELSVIEQKMINGESGHGVYSKKGIKSNISYVHLPEYQWSLGISIPQSEIFSPLKSLSLNLIFTTLITLVAAILIVIFLSRKLVTKPIKKIENVAEIIATGDISVDVEVTSTDEIGNLLNAFKKMIENIRVQSGYAKNIAKGNLNFEIIEKSDKDELSISMKEMIRSLKELLTDSQMLVNCAIEGNLTVRVDTEMHNGAYKDIIDGLNKTLDVIVAPLQIALKQLNILASGEDAEVIENNYHGIYFEFIDNLNKLHISLENMLFETKQVAAKAKDGDLSYRADTSKLYGKFADIVNVINDSFDTIVEPIKESSVVLTELSNGSFDKLVVGDYNGDHAVIKNALNSTISALEKYVTEISSVLSEVSNGDFAIEITDDYLGEFTSIKNSINNIGISLSRMFNEILNAADNVTSGASQVASSSQVLSQASTEQAGAIEELTGSINEIASEIKSNSERAAKANELTKMAKTDAIEGSSQMNQMLISMDKINDSSANINRIIKIIDDIAFQTNILALNAAVEAARAGKYGKGFAVVAEEVRTLAQRSSKAVKETTELIEESIKNVESGTEIANQTSESFTKIVDVVTQTSELISVISDISMNQTSGISQINLGINQVSSVVQQNAAISEESAATSEELSGQAQLLKELISKIKIKDVMSTVSNSFSNTQQQDDDNSSAKFNYDHHNKYFI